MSYLPPEGREALIKETVRILFWSAVAIVALAVVVALTQGVVVKIAP
jgi:hypothetical protein